MIGLLARRSLTHRPWRTAFLLVGYGLGVGVMIVLLAIGEALLSQARDEKLVGGGSLTLLPEGLDIEVMKTGGVGGLYFSIDNARFIYRQLLQSPRLTSAIAAAAPQVEGKLLYLRTGDREIAVRAAGEIPSLSAAVGAAAPLSAGRWVDDEGDRRWRSPTPRELYAEIDRFHLPPADVENRESWGEWHYFNVLSEDGKRWAFISFILGGEIPEGEWGGQLVVTLREEGGRTRRFSAGARPPAIRFSTVDADLRIGESSVELLPDARYAVRAVAREEGTGVPLRLDLIVTPAPRAYFPGATLASGRFTSGYAVPALRAVATGRICAAGRCERYADAQAYHDHNWGVWRGVTWEWGAARAGSYGVLYGRVHPPDDDVTPPPLFVYVVDSLGFRGLFRPREVRYDDARTIEVDGATVRVPATAEFADARGGDTLIVTLTIDDALGTDTRLPLLERGDATAARRLTRPYFIQMKGRMRIRGRVWGEPVEGEGIGFFETYR